MKFVSVRGKINLPIVGWVLASLLVAIPAPADEVSLDFPDGPMSTEIPQLPARPTYSQKQIKRLISLLGDPEYANREMALHKLSKGGNEVVEPLRGVLQSSKDPEQVRRARQALRKVLIREHQRSIEMFVRDHESDHGLPGCGWYARSVGTRPEDRELFARLQRDEAGLLFAAQIGPDEAARALRERFLQMEQARQTVNGQPGRLPEMSTLAAITFVLTDPSVSLPAKVAERDQWRVMWTGSSFTARRVNRDKNGESIRRILNCWIAQDSSPDFAYIKLRMSIRLNAEGGVNLASKLLEQDGLSAFQKMFPLEVIARVGGKSHAARLLPFLNDRTVYVDNTRVCDVALALLIYIHRQKYEDYGLEKAGPIVERIRNRPLRTLGYYYNRCAFPDDTSRNAAIAKWQRWMKKNGQGTAAKLPVSPEIARAKRFLEFGGKSEPPKLQEPAKTLVGDRRQIKIKVDKARALIQEGDYDDAVGLLDSIIAEDNNLPVPDDSRRTGYWFAHIEAERLLGNLPPGGCAAYQLRFGLTAEAWLLRGTNGQDLSALRELSRRFLHLPAGAEATYRLGIRARDFSQPRKASQYLSRVLEAGPLATKFEPLLSLQLADTLRRTGRVNQARAVLRALAAKMPTESITLGGQQVPFFKKTDPLVWMANFLGEVDSKGQAVAGLVSSQAPRRNVVTNAETPWTEPTVSFQVVESPFLRRAIEDNRKAFQASGTSSLNMLEPLVFDGAANGPSSQVAVLRTALGLQARNLANGLLLWASSPDSALRDLVEQKRDQLDRREQGLCNESVRQRVWRDPASQPTSDGVRVFALGDRSQPASDRPRIVLTLQGQLTLANDLIATPTRLSAYDLKTGKLLWERSPPQDGTWLGHPLPLDGVLHAFSRQGSQVALSSLSPETGENLGNLILDLPETLAENAAKQRLSDSRAAGPSFGDGILVGAISKDQFVGVHLATQRVRWFVKPEQVVQAAESIRMDDQGWQDTSVKIADGYALFSPGGSETLTCRDVTSGKRRWSRQCPSALYVGGVDPTTQVVLVVGPRSVSGYRLETGEASWPKIPLPAGALPVGRGLLGSDGYHLPLSSSEVISIDLKRGRIAARSRGPRSVAVGTLVAAGSEIVSQTADQLVVLPSSTAAVNAARLRVQRNPNDLDALAFLGGTLSAAGKFDEVIQTVQAGSQQGHPTSQQLMANAVVQVLNDDFSSYAAMARKHLPSLSDEGRHAVWESYATNALAAGQTSEAFKAMLALVRVPSNPSDELIPLEASRQVRSLNRWQAELQQLYARAVTELRQQYDQVVEQELQKIDLNAEVLNPSLLKSYESFGQAVPFRLRFAQALIDQRQYLEAEVELHSILADGNQAQRDAALQVLNELLKKINKPQIALGSLAAQSSEPAAGWGNKSSWCDSRLWVKVSKDGKRPMGNPLRFQSACDRYTPSVSVRADYYITKVWIQPPGTPEPIEIRLPTGPERKFSAGYFGRSGVCGHLLIVWLGHRVHAIDWLSEQPRVLWSKDVWKPNPFSPNDQRARLPKEIENWRGEPVSTLANRLVVTPRYVCFQQQDRLLCLDPLTGQERWVITGVAESLDLGGNAHRLLVRSEQAETLILDPTDGRVVGRCEMPVGGRIAIRYDALLYRRVEADAEYLRSLDPFTGRKQWECKLADKTQIDVREDEIGLLDPRGDFRLLDIRSGQETLRLKLPEQSALSDLFLIDRPEVLIAVAGVPLTKENYMDGSRVLNRRTFNGTVYAIDRSSGEILWTSQQDRQGYDLTQPDDFPLLIFSQSLYRRETDSTGTVRRTLPVGTQYRGLDLFTGKQLFQQKVGSWRDSAYISADVDSKTLRIVHETETIAIKPSQEEPEAFSAARQAIEE